MTYISVMNMVGFGGWVGDDTNLVSKTDDMSDWDFICCPDCGSTSLEELEETEDAA